MSAIDSVTTSSTNPEDFFDKYVKKRIPCHFKDQFKNGWGLEKWTNEYLKANCQSEVKIEYRDSSSDRFGKGKEIQMPFKTFIEEIESGNELYYMTTQKLDYSAEGQASILSPPMCNLEQDFPINPPIMGNLIVQNINMWMGASAKSVTTGLHHDYHDNLYIVLRGTKQMTLFAPTEHSNMYTVGELAKLHPNGRVNYKGDITCADGSDASAERALKASLDLEKAMLCEGEGESENESDIEQALEDLLDAQIACNDDYSESEEDEEEEEGDDEDEGDGIPLDLSIPQHVLNVDKRKRSNEKEGSDRDSDSELDAKDRAMRKKHKEMAKQNIKEETEKSDGTPPNFSRVDTSLSAEELATQFPLFVAAQRRGAQQTVTLQAGDMLYLPAGWFHEVKSQGSPPLGHMAMNYWFHPPDTQDFKEPYSSKFWQIDWEMRVKSRNI